MAEHMDEKSEGISVGFGVARDSDVVIVSIHRDGQVITSGLTLKAARQLSAALAALVREKD